jgi:hypothetical protein
MLRSRRTRREEPLEVYVPDPIVSRADGSQPEDEVLLADSVGLALLVVLQALDPVERLVFVLHDMFDVPFDEIAPVVERSPAAARPLAGRARRQGKGAAPVPDADRALQHEVVDAFLAAARGGDFGALLAVLNPEVVLRADVGAVPAGASRVIRGAAAWPSRQSRSGGGWAHLRERCSCTEPRVWWRCRVGDQSRRLASRSGAGRSSRSTSSPTPSGCPTWT